MLFFANKMPERKELKLTVFTYICLTCEYAVNNQMKCMLFIKWAWDSLFYKHQTAKQSLAENVFTSLAVKSKHMWYWQNYYGSSVFSKYVTIYSARIKQIMWYHKCETQRDCTRLYIWSHCLKAQSLKYKKNSASSVRQHSVVHCAKWYGK